MRRVHGSMLAVAAIVLVSKVGSAQGGMAGMETSKAVAGGGITVPGWTGQIDPAEAKKGLTITAAKFAKEGAGFRVTTGPAVAYWNPANNGTGDYTVKATFNEAKYMNLNDHPHPYGIMIGGNDLGTDQQSYLYCEAYGDGRFIVRGFGPGGVSFKMNGGGAADSAVHKAAGKDQPVSQDIAMSVKGDKVECAVNGKTVASYDKSAVLGAGKLKSTDGVWGIRFAHNTDATVTGLAMTKP
ncbi:MAG: hypothetical protein ABJF01_04525 [bacterium]